MTVADPLDVRPAAGEPRRLRIIHVDAEREFSGGEVQVFLLIDGLAVRGHQNLLLCRPQSAAAAEAARRGIAVHAVPMHGDLDVVAVRRMAAGSRRPAPISSTCTPVAPPGLAARRRGSPACRRSSRGAWTDRCGAAGARG
jgi:hypothetical protein